MRRRNCPQCTRSPQLNRRARSLYDNAAAPRLHARRAASWGNELENRGVVGRQGCGAAGYLKLDLDGGGADGGGRARF